MNRIHKNVRLGKNVKVEEFAIIGRPPMGRKDGELETVIGDDSLIRSGTVIYAGTVTGKGFATGHGALVRENNRIGNDVSIGSHAVVERDSLISDGVRIHTGAFIPEHTTLKAGSWIGPCCTLVNAPHPLCPKAKECMKGPTVEENAKIGAASVVMPSVKIGKGALVGAGSVVIDDVKAGSVVAGNPAKRIKDVCDLRCKFGLVEKPY